MVQSGAFVSQPVARLSEEKRTSMPEYITLHSMDGDEILISLVDAFLFAWVGWYVDKNGYICGSFFGEKSYLHKLVAHRMGNPPGALVDHADGNKLNNRRENLRPATPAQNRQNSKKKRGSSSEYKGVTKRVSPCGVSWEANCDGYLGLFLLEALAAKAYDLEALRLYGAFARTNFPRDEYGKRASG